MICGNCEHASRVQSEAERGGSRAEPLWQAACNGHIICRGRCSCAHEAYMHVKGTPVGPFYHGGLGGMNPGSWLLPSSVTGIDATPKTLGFALKRDRAYFTLNLDVAYFYARRFPAYPRAVYRVEPVGQLIPDLGIWKDPAENAYTCDRLLVSEVIDPDVTEALSAWDTIHPSHEAWLESRKRDSEAEARLARRPTLAMKIVP